jgi:hypothetical protein
MRRDPFEAWNKKRRYDRFQRRYQDSRMTNTRKAILYMATGVVLLMIAARM